ncbi:MAG: PhoU domain-containing protein [bacterium]
MFKALLELFRRDNLIDQAIAESVKMLGETKMMFAESTKALRHSDTAELGFDIVAKDKMINKFQREVRRKVITHLTVAGTEHSLTAGLVLISIVIDVERIGDYTKNIYELAVSHPQRLDGGLFETALLRIEEEINRRFVDAEKAFRESDDVLAREMMRKHRPITSECEAIISEIIAEKDPSLPVHEAVPLALYIRFLKRVSAHLTNIVSSVANPFPRIGFRDKTANE